jgi:FkbM family methyltransferase
MSVSAPVTRPVDSLQGSLTRLKECRNGRFLFLRTDRYIGRALALYGEYCEAESALFAQILGPGDVAVEFGANIGAHTVQLGRLVGPHGQVLAFEPQRVIFQLLCANLALNDVFNVRTFQAGAGAAAGAMIVPPVDYHHPDSNFGGLSLLANGEGEAVQIIALDDFLLPALKLIKIDIEGMELAALQGARATITRHRPVLYVENDRAENSAALISMIMELGYDLWWHIAPVYRPDNHENVPFDIFGNMVSVNMVGIPRGADIQMAGFKPILSPQDVWDAPE